jgi:hypothetical protein
MGGSSQISGVSQNTIALYKLLRLDDKNRNGVIEKSSIWHPFRRENYREEIDINMDGKIVEAEAKYYLQNLENISPEEKQMFALTDDDRKTLSVLFMERLTAISALKDSDGKSKAISDLASGLAKIGSFKEAFEATRKINNAYYTEITIKYIFSAMAKAGLDRNTLKELLKEAVETAGTITTWLFEDSMYKKWAIEDIVSWIVDAHFDKNETAELFMKTLETARTIGDQYFKSITIGHMALAMAKAGMDNNEVSKVFKEAIGTVQTIESSYYKSAAIKEIAMSITKAGLDKNVLCELLKELLETARPIKNSLDKAWAIEGTAWSIVNAGLDKSILSELLKKLLETAETIEDPLVESNTINEIALAIANAGLDKNGTSKVFKELKVELPWNAYDFIRTDYFSNEK